MNQFVIKDGECVDCKKNTLVIVPRSNSGGICSECLSYLIDFMLFDKAIKNE